MNSLTHSVWPLVWPALVVVSVVVAVSFVFVRRFSPPSPEAAALQLHALNDVDNRKALQLRLFSEYHQQGLTQSRAAFLCSIIFAALGFAVILASVVFLLTVAPPEIRRIEKARAEALQEKAELTQRLDSLNDAEEKNRQRRAEEERAAATQEMLLKAAANEIAAEYSRLSAESAEPVEPLRSSWLIVAPDNEFSSYNSREAVRNALYGRLASVRSGLLSVYLYAIPTLGPMEVLVRTNINSLFSYGPSQAGFLERARELIVASQTHTNTGSNLRRLLELMIRTEIATEQLQGLYITPDPPPGTYSMNRYEAEAALGSQLRGISDDLAALRRSFEVLADSSNDPGVLAMARSVQENNRTNREALLRRYKEINQQAVTNRVLIPALATNIAIIEKKEALAKAERQIAMLDEQRVALDSNKSIEGASGSSSAEKPLAVLGVVSGTIIDAIAGLFFVQSNRARQLLVQFFDRLRGDRKLDDAMRLAESVPDATVKSGLLRDLSLILARENTSSSRVEIDPKDTPKDQPRVSI